MASLMYDDEPMKGNEGRFSNGYKWEVVEDYGDAEVIVVTSPCGVQRTAVFDWDTGQMRSRYGEFKSFAAGKTRAAFEYVAQYCE